MNEVSPKLTGETIFVASVDSFRTVYLRDPSNRWLTLNFWNAELAHTTSIVSPATLSATVVAGEFAGQLLGPPMVKLEVPTRAFLEKIKEGSERAMGAVELIKAFEGQSEPHVIIAERQERLGVDLTTAVDMHLFNEWVKDRISKNIEDERIFDLVMELILRFRTAKTYDEVTLRGMNVALSLYNETYPFAEEYLLKRAKRFLPESEV